MFLKVIGVKVVIEHFLVLENHLDHNNLRILYLYMLKNHGLLKTLLKTLQKLFSSLRVYICPSQGLRGFLYFSSCEHGSGRHSTDRANERVPHTGPRHGAC